MYRRPVDDEAQRRDERKQRLRDRKQGIALMHIFRWSWLGLLYLVLFAWIFGTLGAWQFQDRLRVAAGNAERAEAWRIALIEARDGRFAKLASVAKSIGDLAPALPGQKERLKIIAEKATNNNVEQDDVNFLVGLSTTHVDLFVAINDATVAVDYGDANAKFEQMVIEAGHANLLGLASAPNGGAPEALSFTPSALTARLIAGVQPDTGRLATWPQGHLTILLTLLMGILGSTLYTTRFMLDYAIKGYKLTEPAPYPTSWFLFRPLFGAATALALFVLVKAGQLAFSLDSAGTETPLNPFLIAFVAIVAGLMSWQALDLIQTTGARWLTTQAQEPQWAVGLQRVLEHKGRSVAALAAQIGRSPRQVKRWLRFRDKVSPEMQQRIVGALSDREGGQIPVEQLFGSDIPAGQPERAERKAKDLKAVLEASDRTAGDVAYRLQVPRKDVDAWIDGSKAVGPAEQEALADMLDQTIADLFEPAAKQQEPEPKPRRFAELAKDKKLDAAGLVKGLEGRGKQVGVSTAKPWIAGKAVVPSDLRADVAAVVGVDERSIDWSI